MIVRFDFERGDEAVADIHHTRGFARALYDEVSSRWEPLEVDFAGFVGAVLAPHHGEDAKFGDVGITAENLLNAPVFLVTDAMFGCDFRRDFDFGRCRGHYAVALAAPTRDSV